jgi:hypothetical protein
MRPICGNLYFANNPIWPAKSVASRRVNDMPDILGCRSGRNGAILTASKPGLFAIAANDDG